MTRGPTSDRTGDRRSVVARVFQILDAFAEEDSELPAAELVRRTRLPKSTVHRLTNDLVDHGLLVKRPGGVALGRHLFELGCLVPPFRRLRQVALPYMEDLYEATHEIVHLAVLDGGDVLYLVKIAGHNQVPLPTRDGARLPGHATALGKAILAKAPRAVVAEVLGRQLVALTVNTIVRPGVLRQQLTEAARVGVAFDREESFLGVACVAAPVVVPGYVPGAAVSVTGPTSRFDPAAVASAVHSVAQAITRALAARPATPA